MKTEMLMIKSLIESTKKAYEEASATWTLNDTKARNLSAVQWHLENALNHLELISEKEEKEEEQS